MATIRFRYYTWLINAYIKKWKKTVLLSTLLGIIIFFGIFYFLRLYLEPLLQKKIVKVGYAGVYSIDSLPDEILNTMSYGLTKVASDGSIQPAAAYKWNVKNGGKEYIFYLKKGQYFHDGEELTAQDIPLSFKDVKKQALDQFTIDFQLKTPYAPFLATVSRPIFIRDFIGLGAYKLNDVDLNAGFVKTLVLQKTNNASMKQTISFYPTQDALKTAFMLGEVDQVVGLDNTTVLQNKDLSQWNNAHVDKTTDYTELVTLFYNNEDPILNDKKVRQALTYALPDSFIEGIRAYSPIPPTSLYFSKAPNYGITDPDISKTLLSSSKDYAHLTIQLSTTDEFLEVAKKIQTSWSKIGIKTTIKVVDGIPPDFQVLLYKFKVPQDPDQYTLWHSQGINNISNYNKSVRIDKLLEDGRLTINTDDRLKIYADFQKYLLDDAPAAFLYFPYKYTVTKK